MVMPSDQMSDLKSYVSVGQVSHTITSGAIQNGVPMNVVCFCSVCLFLADTPKSAARRRGGEGGQSVK